ncbi:hypothetical protein AB0P21_07725 [Kribbella sp. NPDC056861]|uniref:hypothetical protein n=1 Tax=Kribbella sp. NPDC056861 TaxID=3154857 RepID=UPI00343060FB
MTTVDFVMTEHASWSATADGASRIVAMPDGGRWLVTTDGGSIVQQSLDESSMTPTVDVFSLSGRIGAAPELTAALSDMGTVARMRNLNLWDAIGTAIIRQVIRAGQAKKLYRAFCEEFGEQAILPDGQVHSLFPGPEMVLKIGADEFKSVGMAFKRPAIQAAAQAYIDHSELWHDLEPTDLIDALQTVPRIGPWTARAAVADWSNDWSLYPYADLAVRTWAKRAAPSYVWPSDEPAFEGVWRTLAGDHLSSLTLLTLAWGSKHGDIG